MATAITIDSTLISAVISAAVAIIVACGTVFLTNHSNNKKLKNAKKEELIECLYGLRSATADYYYNIFSINRNDVLKSVEKKEILLAKISVILNIYFRFEELSMASGLTKVDDLFMSASQQRSVIDEKNAHALQSINSAIEEALRLKP
ncbi:hypothetical protein [Serratia bockelmannii]|uniref:hypothetical protein n=1 Tax=Serratia bockelmannii TaxID=2703793 RepID=UPI003FA6C1E6